MTIERVAVIGLGLLGGSVGLAIADRLPGVVTTGYDSDAAVRRRAAERGLVGTVCESAGEAVRDSDLVLLCVPVGAIEEAARHFAADLPAHAIVSDVGSSKLAVAEALARALPGHRVIPAHPVAGTEQSGPDAGFATLFSHRWCILTPAADADPGAIGALTAFWEALGARIELMDAEYRRSKSSSLMLSGETDFASTLARPLMPTLTS